MGALARFAAQLTDHILAAVRSEVDGVRNQLTVGVVSSVKPGAGKNGSDLVSVNWRGGTYPVAHLSHYTPSVGHVVQMTYSGSQLVIQGRIIGGPRA